MSHDVGPRRNSVKHGRIPKCCTLEGDFSKCDTFECDTIKRRPQRSNTPGSKRSTLVHGNAPETNRLWNHVTQQFFTLDFLLRFRYVT